VSYTPAPFVVDPEHRGALATSPEYPSRAAALSARAAASPPPPPPLAASSLRVLHVGVFRAPKPCTKTLVRVRRRRTPPPFIAGRHRRRPVLACDLSRRIQIRRAWSNPPHRFTRERPQPLDLDPTDLDRVNPESTRSTQPVLEFLQKNPCVF
jgi:hypothetical protein